MNITNSYHKLGNSFYQEQRPDKVQNPTLIIFNHNLAKELNLNLGEDDKDNKEDKKYLADVFSGNKLLANSKPIALAYAGHQFGNFVPQLGDGRAVLLGEIKDKGNILQDIQLKGTGRTFFSRNGDGKCPLDATIREYLVSEAMHHLGIPTTRALAMVKLDEFLQRQELVPAGIITRIAKSHIRIGSFEYFAANGAVEKLKTLADYSINRHFKHLLKYENHTEKYTALLNSVIKLQAELVASWMSIGFIHGVMNTDNTTISGQTIDYGPCAFMDEYESDKVFSFIDTMGRYNFANQKNVILWNLVKFAETLLPLITDGTNSMQQAINIMQEELHKFPSLFDGIYYNKMASKIGIFDFQNLPKDKDLIDDFLAILAENHIDFTNGFRILSKILQGQACFYAESARYLAWQEKWINRLEAQNKDLNKIARKMDEINPILIPRNHIIADIIQKSVFENDYSEFHKFLLAIQKPFVEKTEYSEYYRPPNADERVINTFCGT